MPGAGRIAARIASLGYAVPGTVLAIGLLTPLQWLDQSLGDIVGATGLVVMGSMAGLACAYVIRFLSIPTGALLVFVDTMKELPATLLLRPLNFDTLATWLYAEAARGTYEEGAITALAIVLAGLAPVIMLARTNVKMGH